MQNVRITCWVNPQSGRDLLERASSETLLALMSDVFPTSDRAKTIISEMPTQHEGMVLKDFCFKTSSRVDSVQIWMQKIKEHHPEAEISSWDTVDVDDTIRVRILEGAWKNKEGVIIGTVHENGAFRVAIDNDIIVPFFGNEIQGV